MAAGLLYSLVRVLLDAIATSRRDQAKLQAEVLGLRRQVQVLERQIKRVKWCGVRKCRHAAAYPTL